MQILNIAGYKFTKLEQLDELKAYFFTLCQATDVKGTILLSDEGININLAAQEVNIRNFQAQLTEDFRSIKFHETYSDKIPFKTLKIKIKPEIITLRQSTINPLLRRAKSITPKDFKQWLDDRKDLTILDTRNDYEVQIGTFNNAINLHIDDFGEFPDAVKQIEKDKPVVMFCTGGIRCEKAALCMEELGFDEVYQLDGGILGYFAQVGGEHYKGECFVFDDRIAVDTNLHVTEKLHNI